MTSMHKPFAILCIGLVLFATLLPLGAALLCITVETLSSVLGPRVSVAIPQTEDRAPRTEDVSAARLRAPPALPA
jgi:hypothetical protein